MTTSYKETGGYKKVGKDQSEAIGVEQARDDGSLDQCNGRSGGEK